MRAMRGLQTPATVVWVVGGAVVTLLLLGGLVSDREARTAAPQAGANGLGRDGRAEPDSMFLGLDHANGHVHGKALSQPAFAASSLQHEAARQGQERLLSDVQPNMAPQPRGSLLRDHPQPPPPPPQFDGGEEMLEDGDEELEDGDEEPEGGAPLPRLMVRQASVIFAVDQHKLQNKSHAVDMVASLQAKTKTVGGYVENLELTIQHAELTLRIPEAEYFAFMAFLRGLSGVTGVVLQRETASAEDVTRQIVDASSRVDTLTAAHAQYLKLMERAGDVRAVLAVQREADRTKQELDSMLSLQRNLRGRVSMSKIRVSIRDVTRHIPIAPPRRVPHIRPIETALSGLRNLLSFFLRCLDLLILFVVFWVPVLLFCAGISAVPILLCLRSTPGQAARRRCAAFLEAHTSKRSGAGDSFAIPTAQAPAVADDTGAP